MASRNAYLLINYTTHFTQMRNSLLTAFVKYTNPKFYYSSNSPNHRII